MLQLTAQQLEQLHHHALSCYPEECCGLLLGQTHQGMVQVIQIWPTENSWTPNFLSSMSTDEQDIRPTVSSHASRLNRFAIAPIEILRAQKYARSKNLDIVGIYHSHPDHPAVPSEYDRKIAWQQYSYVIMSVTARSVEKTLSWRLTEDHQFRAEPLAIAPR